MTEAEGPEDGTVPAGCPPQPAGGAQGPGDRVMERLNENVVKLAERLERMNLADYLELTRRPARMFWVNFLSGLARGVGIFLGAGVMGALTLAAVTALVYWLLNFFNMLPVVGQLARAGMDAAGDFISAHGK